MQRNPVQPVGSQRGMSAKGGNGQSEFWARRPMAYYHCNKSNKQLCHRLERRHAAREVAAWEVEFLRDLHEDVKELKALFEDYYECGDDKLMEDYFLRTKTAPLLEFARNKEDEVVGYDEHGDWLTRRKLEWVQLGRRLADFCDECGGYCSLDDYEPFYSEERVRMEADLLEIERCNPDGY